MFISALRVAGVSDTSVDISSVGVTEMEASCVRVEPAQ